MRTVTCIVLSVLVVSGCDDGGTTAPQADVAAADGSITSDAEDATAEPDVVATDSAVPDAPDSPSFSVSVSASPPAGPLPLNVTLVATVDGDIGIDEVTLQWYRGDTRLEGKTEPAWIILLVETTTMRVEATHTAIDGATTMQQGAVTVDVTPN